MGVLHKIIKLLMGETKRKKFKYICNANHLQLTYYKNSQELQILSDIFEKREYADYFPFYKKATIIDIGAHFGYFSIFAHKNTHPQSTILAIEPAALNFNQMCANLKENNIENVVLLQTALGANNENSILHTGRSSNHSLISNYRLLNKTESAENVKCTTLESILNKNNIEKIDFLKMDCEGSEYAIFESLSKAIFEKITTISMEFHDLKSEKYTADFLIQLFIRHQFKIVKFHYMPTTKGLNYGKIIATKDNI
jgi:FkbM family methyltransferase